MRARLLHAAIRGHRIGIAGGSRRAFATTPSSQAANHIYPARIRNQDELHTLVLMSASSRVPLITLWMTTWSRDCDQVSAVVKEVIETDRIGEDQGGVSFVEVEMDSPDLGGVSSVAQRYFVNAVPTLLAFDRGEPQVETKVWRMEQLKSKSFISKWVETEAARHGQGGSGGSLGGMFGQ